MSNQSSIQELILLPSSAANVDAYSAPINVLGSESFTAQFFITGSVVGADVYIQATLKESPNLATDDDWDLLVAKTAFTAKGSQIWKSEGNGAVAYRYIRVKYDSTNAGNDGTVLALANVVTRR